MAKSTSEQKNWFITRTGMAITGILALFLTYIMASRALDTGSLGQYGLAFLLLIIGINRLVRGIRNK